MNHYQGPSFTQVDTVSVDELDKQGGFKPRARPLLVKGAVKRWPAWNTWTFEQLSKLKNKDGTEVIASFQNGLVEQGMTKKPVFQPISPYLQNLGLSAESITLEQQLSWGLCPKKTWANLKKNESFFLNWEYLKTFPANHVYLAQWYILKEFPNLKKDFAINTLWNGLRLTWEYVFMGPSQTVTGLHFDFPNNWFCQVRGVKEVILFPPENSQYLCESKKYDWGATLSDVDITQIDQQPEIREIFAKAKGLYARVEAGDALFIPKRTWHGVVALEPSISLAVFGLTIPEIVLGGGASETRSLLHKIGLYRKDNCTCHRMIKNANGKSVSMAVSNKDLD